MTWKPFRPPRVEDDTVPIKRSLEHIAKKLGSGSPGAVAVIFDDWENTVGEELAGKLRPESLVDGVLVVSVADSMWLSQVKWMTGGIAESINRNAGFAAVERVEVRLRRPSAPK